MPTKQLPTTRVGQSMRVGPWPPSRTQVATVHSTANERDVVWRFLAAPAELQAQAISLFGTKAAVRKYWPDFRMFVDQARVYDDAARLVPGSSKALLEYYTALQLAKAELLVRQPEVVHNKRIRHGLVFHPEAKRTFRGDAVTVDNGVFSHLYRVRTGNTLARGTELRVIQLLGCFSDIGYEFIFGGFGQNGCVPIEHYVVFNNTNAWSLAVLHTSEPFTGSQETMRTLLRTYREVGANIAGIILQPNSVVLESRWTVALQEPPTCAVPDQDAVCRRALQTWAPFLGVPMYGSTQASPSLHKSRYLPMPPDLARYACVFYLSSVVRYKPSRLAEGGVGWLMDALAEESGLHLLRAALRGITGTQYSFTSPEGFALGYR